MERESQGLLGVMRRLNKGESIAALPSDPALLLAVLTALARHEQNEGESQRQIREAEEIAKRRGETKRDAAGRE